MNKPILALAVLLLAGCATDKPVIHEPEVTPLDSKVEVPATLLKKCAPLPQLEDRQYSQDDFVKFYNRSLTVSEDCRSRQAVLVDTVKNAFNVK